MFLVVNVLLFEEHLCCNDFCYFQSNPISFSFSFWKLSKIPHSIVCIFNIWMIKEEINQHSTNEKCCMICSVYNSALYTVVCIHNTVYKLHSCTPFEITVQILVNTRFSYNLVNPVPFGRCFFVRAAYKRRRHFVAYLWTLIRPTSRSCSRVSCTLSKGDLENVGVYDFCFSDFCEMSLLGAQISRSVGV